MLTVGVVDELIPVRLLPRRQARNRTRWNRCSGNAAWSSALTSRAGYSCATMRLRIFCNGRLGGAATPA